jgi:hypothetical protein
VGEPFAVAVKLRLVELPVVVLDTEPVGLGVEPAGVVAEAPDAPL